MSKPESSRERADGLSLRQSYHGLRRLLATHAEMMEKMAELEADLSHKRPEASWLADPVASLFESCLLLAQDLTILTKGELKGLYQAEAAIEDELRRAISLLRVRKERATILTLDSISPDNQDAIGGKSKNLAALGRAFPDNVLPGFVLSVTAYWEFMGNSRLLEAARELLADLSIASERADFSERAQRIRDMVTSAPLPESITRAIAEGVAAAGLKHVTNWAVRSSGIGEDGELSFAGQYDSFLDVAPSGLADAYRKVVASRYNDRAIWYRMAAGLGEVDTPMAVLFLPMIEARCSGVIYTRDPFRPEMELALANVAEGVGARMVRGAETGADTVVFSRSDPPSIVEWSREVNDLDPKLESALIGLADLAMKVERHFGRPQDIEFAIDRDWRVFLVQARPLLIESASVRKGRRPSPEPTPLLEGGFAVYPGRAVGQAWVVDETHPLEDAPEGTVVVVDKATPELGQVIPRVAAVVAESGKPTGHAATLLREFRVPSVLEMAGAIGRIEHGRTVSLDATRRRVFAGALWEAGARPSRQRAASPTDPLRLTLRNRIFDLHLTDTQSSNFKASKCQSIHDILRFAHEKSVAAIFDMGDRVATSKTSIRPKLLETAVPMNLYVLDLGGALAEPARAGKTVTPDLIESAPWKALWTGMADPRVKWSGRKNVSWAGWASVIASSTHDTASSVRKLGSRNYLMVGPDYVNLNARLAYHFTLVDALVTEVAENNYVNFRFHGGGATADRRDHRALFLSEVLLSRRFAVDRRGDMVTAWLRMFPKHDCEDALIMLGRLMACSRQLDMLLDTSARAKSYARSFLSEDFKPFE